MRVLHANYCISRTNHEYLLPLLYPHQHTYADDCLNGTEMGGMFYFSKMYFYKVDGDLGTF